MNVFTLKLNNSLAKQLDRFCRQHGYKKTDLIISLIRNFFKKKQKETKLKKLVGMVSLGGNAVKDAEIYFE